jgi:hypothetical protein
VSVSIASGVAQITSLLPELLPYARHARLGKCFKRYSCIGVGWLMEDVLTGAPAPRPLRRFEFSFGSGDRPQPMGIHPESTTPRGCKSTLAQLSVAALRYAQHLDVDDVRTLEIWLYTYNRHVLTPCWARRLSTREAAARHLGLSAGVQGRDLVPAGSR